VYESSEEPGGMMRYGAAEFRFPGEALRFDMKRIFDRGVRFRGGATIGGNVPFSSLEREGYEAVLVASGTPVSRTIPGSGTEEQGFHDARSFLESVRRTHPIHLPGGVVVIGGGDVAVDAARSALRLGAQDVTIACIEAREAMPAHPWEIEDALAEGVKLLTSTAVTRFVLKDGRVAGIEAIRAERFHLDAKGGIVPHTLPGTGFEVRAESVVMAVGSEADLGFLPPISSRIAVDKGQNVFRLIFRGSAGKIPVYIFGDCAAGPGTVVEAAASGRAAAVNIYSILCVENGKMPRYMDNYRRLPEPHISDRPEWRFRGAGVRMPPDERRGNFAEVEKGFTEAGIREEAERCARCNLSL